MEKLKEQKPDAVMEQNDVGEQQNREEPLLSENPEEEGGETRLPLDGRLPMSGRCLVTETARARSRFIVAKNTSNVLTLFEVSHLRFLSIVNFALALMSLLYVGINIVGLYWNSKSEAYRLSIEHSIHKLEFWATFVFALVETVALIYSLKPFSAISSNPKIFKIAVFFNIVSASVPPILYTLHPERNEFISHQIEYGNEVTLAFIDLVFLWSIVRARASNSTAVETFLKRFADIAAGLFSVAFAITQICVYNFADNGEQISHFMEFPFGIVAGFISFWFCVDNKFAADNRLEAILCGCYSGHHMV